MQRECRTHAKRKANGQGKREKKIPRTHVLASDVPDSGPLWGPGDLRTAERAAPSAMQAQISWLRSLTAGRRIVDVD